ncbi:MAG: hypothetical protein ACW99Q_04090 [Candidatus Kariarchaeaceae archaeon]|jgi:hypothetical protein
MTSKPNKLKTWDIFIPFMRRIQIRVNKPMSMLIAKITSFSKTQKLVWFFVGIIGSVICQLLFSPINSLMDDTGYNILDLEFAWNARTLDPILVAWEPIMDDVKIFMVIDMFFPIFYFLALNGWSLLINHEGKGLRVVTIAAVMASVFDYIENLFTFVVLFNPDNYVFFAPFAISLFATLKFLFIIFVVLRNLVRMVFKR